jgi:DNA adenine methylase
MVTARKAGPAPAPVARPFVKWAGGKNKLLPELLRRSPQEFNRYYEPFVGGGALFYALAAAHPTTPPRRNWAVLSDTNVDLMTVYRVVRNHAAPLIEELKRMKRAYTSKGERYFYRIRDVWNEETGGDDIVRRAAQFIFLNKTCFNGLWRVNADGNFNVSHGDYKDPRICDADNLRAASEALHHTRFDTGPYEQIAKDADVDDFVYFDPPYDPVSKTANFVGYQAGGFGAEQQHDLAVFAGKLVARHVKVMLSNSDTQFIRSLYGDLKGFTIDRVLAPRAINSDASKRGGVPELIIRGGYP